MDEGKVGQQIYAETSPELLTAFLFGRRPAEECFSFRNGYRWEREGLLQGLERIKTLATYASTKLSEGEGQTHPPQFRSPVADAFGLAGGRCREDG
ncbi:MAG: hypothetical protein ACLVLH_14780 [Eisenbergiella massiliensis]